MFAALTLALVWHAFRLNPNLQAAVDDSAVKAAVSWDVPTQSAISSSPTYSNGVVYVGGNDRSVSAIDFDSGRLRWRVYTDNDVMAAPLIYHGLLFVTTGDQLPKTWKPPHRVVFGEGPSTLYALDPRTGAPIWHRALAASGMASPVISSGLVIHLDGAGTMMAFDARTGKIRWQRELGSSSVMSQPVDLGDGTVLVSGGFPNAVYRVRVRNGTIVWEHRFPDCLAAFTDQPIAADTERVYGAYLRMHGADPRCFGYTGLATQFAYALALRTGKLLWSQALSSGITPARNEAAIPLVQGARVFMGSAIAPAVNALDAASGKILWRKRVHGAVKGGMVASGGSIYFGDHTGSLWALDQATGATRGELHERVRFNVGSPLIVNKTLVIGSLEGDVLAVPLAEIARP